MVLVFSVRFVNGIRDPVFTSPQKNRNELFTKNLCFADIQLRTRIFVQSHSLNILPFRHS